MNRELDVITHVLLDSTNVEATIKTIEYQYETYGFKKFVLCAKTLGFRSKGHPPKEFFIKLAKAFLVISQAVSKKGIQCGWWVHPTIKSGRSKDFQAIVKSNGEESPFANCPHDKNFATTLAQNIAQFAKIAKPEFIFIEDDFSITSASGKLGCFCPLHLAEFSKREGKNYSREELLEIFNSNTPNGFALLKRFKALMLDSMVEISKLIRSELDKENPNIPIVLCEPGSTDSNGEMTEPVAVALAGKNNVPMVRFHGTFYNGGESKSIPGVLYHATYMKEHVKSKIKFYHETDSYPQTRFFTSAKQMRAIMAIAFSTGFEGTFFLHVNSLDTLASSKEESAYGKMLLKEKERFNNAYLTSRLCERVGVELPYTAFYNALDGGDKNPYWTRFVTLLGIPYTTKNSNIAFIDERQAKHLTESELLNYLNKVLFLDGDGAKALCERGLGKYIGVSVGEDVTEGLFNYDLDAKEVIEPEFAISALSNKMPPTQAFCVGRNGKQYSLKKNSEQVKTITKTFTFDDCYVTDGATFYENELGGKIVVMGMTLKDNISQALFNYRRKALTIDLLKQFNCNFPMVLFDPNVHLICNKAKDPNEAQFEYMLSLINVGDDNLSEISLYLPKEMQNLTPYYYSKADGFTKVDFEKADGNITIKHLLDYCNFVCIYFK